MFRVVEDRSLEKRIHPLIELRSNDGVYGCLRMYCSLYIIKIKCKEI